MTAVHDRRCVCFDCTELRILIGLGEDRDAVGYAHARGLITLEEALRGHLFADVDPLEAWRTEEGP